MTKSGSLTVIVFSRGEIVPCSLDGFLARFGSDALPTGGELAAMMNSFVFTLVDYDDDSREIYDIPEVKRFYSRLWAVWPFWFFFCNLEVHELLAVVGCVVPSVIKVQDLTHGTIGVKFDTPALQSFMVRGFNGLNLMSQRANLTQRQVAVRTQQIAAYFQPE